jgi:hypothetical protein
LPHENTDSKILMLAKGVLALTKVNWNTTQCSIKRRAAMRLKSIGRRRSSRVYPPALVR